MQMGSYLKKDYEVLGRGVKGEALSARKANEAYRQEENLLEKEGKPKADLPKSWRAHWGSTQSTEGAES